MIQSCRSTSGFSMILRPSSKSEDNSSGSDDSQVSSGERLLLSDDFIKALTAFAAEVRHHPDGTKTVPYEQADALQALLWYTFHEHGFDDPSQEAPF